MDSRSALFSAPANEKESIMNLKRTMLAVLAGITALAAAPVFADNDRHEERGWRGEHGYGHHYHGDYYYAPRPRVIYAPQVVYPAPAYYPPAPVYYQPPRYYQPAPVYVPAPVSSGISISFRLPIH
jgi:hypothetical protein